MSLPVVFLRPANWLARRWTPRRPSAAQRARRLFGDHVQPLYQELFDLHVDYSGRFQALYRAARKGEAIDTPPTEERQRFGMRHRQARASARAMLRRELPEAAAAFFEAVEGYFSYLPPDTSDTTTAERYVIRIVRATPKGCDPRIRWAYLIKDTIRELGSRWREVVETYAEARASLL